MKSLKLIIKYAWRVLASLVIIFALAILVTSFSRMYDFAPAQPFSGDDIFNPYAEFNPDVEWKRTSLHTHTRVKGPLNECEFSADETWAKYQDFGYDIVGISNHNEITPHPAKEQDIRIYEHGYNLRNFHKLVIGTNRVNRFDALLPVFASQAQWQLEMLGDECEVLQLNHPSRSSLLDSTRLVRIAGYDIMELSGVTTYLENLHYDWALSAGRYSFALLNDDLHYPDRSGRFAVRCSFLGAKSNTTKDVLATLKNGCFYSMRIPDYGEGDWTIKQQRNAELPSVTNIGVKGDTIYMALSAPAEQIRVIGQNHTLLHRATQCDSIAYRMTKEDPYARFVVSYPDSLIIMTNPFARYDKEKMSSPAGVDGKFYSPNTATTILYNIVVGILIVLVVLLYMKILKRWKTR